MCICMYVPYIKGISWTDFDAAVKFGRDRINIIGSTKAGKARVVGSCCKSEDPGELMIIRLETLIRDWITCGNLLDCNVLFAFTNAACMCDACEVYGCRKSIVNIV